VEYVKEEKQLWGADKLRDYLFLVQRILEPCVTEEAELILKAYY